MNRKQRVVVQLSDFEHGNKEERYNPAPRTTLGGAGGAMSSKFPHPYRPPNHKRNTDLEVLNDHTLKLCMHGQQHVQPRLHCYRQMNFDVVCNSYDARTRLEITQLMDQLLLNHNNCCLMRFSALRECKLSFLCNLVVTEVDSRLQQLHAQIHSIKMEYFDVRKYDVIDMLEDKGKNRFHRRNEFQSTIDLLNWLQSDYTQLWNSGQGHECLDFQFVFSDLRKRVYEVKLSVVQLYITKMDNNTKISLRNFMENVNGGDKKIKPSVLTDCLKEYMNGLYHTWMIFDVPQAAGNTSIADEILKFANAAYSGVKDLKNDQEEEDDNLSLDIDSDIVMSNIKLLSRSDLKPEPPKSASRSNLRPSLSHEKFSPGKKSRVNWHARQEKKKPEPLHSTGTSNISNKDLNSLSYWYSKTDEKFMNVLVAMEAYYEHKYTMNISKMCGDIKHMMRTIDRNTLPDCDSEARGSKVAAIEDLRMYYEQYKAAIVSFRVIAREIKRSEYGDSLKVYLKTKNYELTQHALSLKLKHLQYCQIRLSDTIKTEQSALNGMRKTNLQNQKLKAPDECGKMGSARKSFPRL